MAKYLDYEGLELYTDYVKGKLDGKAASSHNHSAANITSGTLAVARGGTGPTSSPSMLTNLGSTSAAPCRTWGQRLRAIPIPPPLRARRGS